MRGRERESAGELPAAEQGTAHDKRPVTKREEQEQLAVGDAGTAATGMQSGKQLPGSDLALVSAACLPRLYA